MACGPGPQRREIDLAAALPAAATTVESRGLDLGAAWARPFLGSGWWAQDEADAEGASFTWSNGPRSTLVFDLVSVRDLELVLDGRPFTYPGASRQTVGVEINGRRLVELVLAASRRAYPVTAPAAYLRRGRNRLDLTYGRADRPRDVVPGARDGRALGVAWYGLGIGEPVAVEPPTVRATANGSLVLPAGSAVDYFVTLAPGSRLAFELWSARGDAPVRLSIEVEEEGRPTRTLAALSMTDTGSGAELDLGRRSGLARLGLRASPTGTGAAVLTRPRLLQPASRAPPSTASAPERPRKERVHRGAGKRPDIIVYLIDTLRADRLGCYGYQRPISPVIDAFAASGVRFAAAFAPSSWTRASVASLMTGLGPRDHGANRRDEALTPAADTLAESLRTAGYATAAIVTNPNVSEPFGFDQGFDHFAYLVERTRAEAVNRAAWAWLDQRGDDDRPFFLYLHTLEPHAPYDPPAAARAAWAPDVDAELAKRSLTVLDDLQAGRRPVSRALLDDLGRLYDAEIAHNDAAFGALLEGLSERGLLDDTVIALVSDHGEEFFEHGNLQHGRELYIESVAVPFLLRLPGGPVGRTVETPVSLIDLHATVLDLAGAAPGGQGTSVLPWLDEAPGGTRAPADRRIVSYLHLDGPRRLAIREDGWSFLAQLGADGAPTLPRLFDLRNDPGETRNLDTVRGVRSGFLASELRALLLLPRELDAAAHVEIDDELRESLRALGYIE